MMMGDSAGLTLRIEGGLGISSGNDRPVRAIAVCTSCEAASMLRLRLNCNVMDVRPRALVDVMASRPGMAVNPRSSGVATEEAIVSGLAPGIEALTEMVGKSTFGRSLTGRAV